MPRAEKKITSAPDLVIFRESETHAALLNFIRVLASSVEGIRRSTVPVPSQVSPCGKLVTFLDRLMSWIETIPYQSNELQRFGSNAFRNWWIKLEEECKTRVIEIVQECDNAKPHVEELVSYLLHSFGNSILLHYGTGHELNFLVLLYVLTRIGFFEPKDFRAVILHVFWKYIELMRKIQTRYQLEPAGSCGVWGLDDFHHLPLIFGAAQLFRNADLRPSVITDKQVVLQLSNEFMYLDHITWILERKKGFFHEHSSMLYNIGGLPKWEDVCDGLVKMYDGEILGKLSVMQHFLFGALCPFGSEKKA